MPHSTRSHAPSSSQQSSPIQSRPPHDSPSRFQSRDDRSLSPTQQRAGLSHYQTSMSPKRDAHYGTSYQQSPNLSDPNIAKGSFSPMETSTATPTSMNEGPSVTTPTAQITEDTEEDPIGPSQIFKATYSGVPVYEMICKGVAVMRRREDSYLNATQILKVADFDKPQRTRILEREVQRGEHEKVQGGYGKYQGKKAEGV